LLLLGRLGGGDPAAAAGLELQAITAVVLGGAALSGGRGSIIGTLLGVLLIGLISNALNVAGVKQAYLQLIYGGVLMLSVIYSSLVGRWRRRPRAKTGAGG
jgi:ribose transport system permease protein